MTQLKILICGGGIAGPSLAYWLSRAGHNVTIVERFSSLRATGAQIDLRAQGIQVVKRMQLLDTIKTRLVDEAGVTIINQKGEPQATIWANKSGKGVQGPTSEYEIMRGDLVRILHDATRENVNYVFGKSVEGFEQDEKGVDVRFSDGQSERFDLLVGADGQSSRIRSAILPDDAPDPLRRLGLATAYWFLPRDESDSNMRKSCHAPGQRLMMSRSHNSTETQAYFFLKTDEEIIRTIPRAPIEEQKEFWASRFRDAGWQAERFIKSMETTENFYCQEVVQVVLDSWSNGRVVLLGDAAHCPSPVTGMGTTSAFTGAYVLAGELTKNSDNIPLALKNYETTLRPFINDIQKPDQPFVKYNFPQTAWGIWALHTMAWLLCTLRVPELIFRFKSEERAGWSLPGYPQLDYPRE